MIGADLIIAAAGAVLAIVALYMELPIWMVMVVSVSYTHLFIKETQEKELPEDWDIGYKILIDKDGITKQMLKPTYQISICLLYTSRCV